MNCTFDKIECEIVYQKNIFNKYYNLIHINNIINKKYTFINVNINKIINKLIDDIKDNILKKEKNIIDIRYSVKQYDENNPYDYLIYLVINKLNEILYNNKKPIIKEKLYTIIIYKKNNPIMISAL